MVTHGFTFVSLEKFTAVAKAVKRFAFKTSELPVVLSLEMHCGLEQQATLAKMLLEIFGDRLLPPHAAEEDASPTGKRGAVDWQKGATTRAVSFLVEGGGGGISM